MSSSPSLSAQEDRGCNNNKFRGPGPGPGPGRAPAREGLWLGLGDKARGRKSQGFLHSLVVRSR